jgi:hypothetical protein
LPGSLLIPFLKDTKAVLSSGLQLPPCRWWTASAVPVRNKIEYMMTLRGVRRGLVVKFMLEELES